MARGPKKHLKRIAAPSGWQLDKLTGIYAPRPSCGPHKLRECIPLALILRNRLKYAFTYDETKMIVMQRYIKIDGKVRTDNTFPCGFMDLIHIEKSKEYFRLLYDPKGRFVTHKIRAEEATYKLCRIKKICVGPKKVPYAITHDGRTLRYIHPEIKANDTVRLNIEDGKVIDWVKFELGNLAMITGGHNIGRVGTIIKTEKHLGSFEIVHVKDARGNEFSTRMTNVFVIGKGSKPWISLPKDNGIRLTILEDRQRRLAKMNRA